MINKIKDIKKNREIVNSIDWEMTPEEAVRLYLEWGNNWASGNYVVRSKDDVAYYFVVYAWENRPFLLLIKRNSEEAVELAKTYMPRELEKRFSETDGQHKGVYKLSDELKSWLKKELDLE